MFYVRATKTASGATAVQVVTYRYRKMIVLKHFGSAHTTEDSVSLKAVACRWIEKTTHQQKLLSDEEKKLSLPLVSTDKLKNLGFYYLFAYETLIKLLQLFFGEQKEYQLLLDLVLIRIIQPASKLESFALLQKLFGKKYRRADFYQSVPKIVGLKETVEKSVVAKALKHFSFDFSIVFYDVTTLYFESFTEDTDNLDVKGNVLHKGLKRNGWSKDLKFSQPQIVIGLIVTSDGFPVSFEVFEGNTFEGDTFIPVIATFKKKYKVETLTVVADAAMISFDNVEKLKEHELSYIVGARIANLKDKELKRIGETLIGQNQTVEELQKIDGKSTRIQTELGLLVCDFSIKRYRKDKREMEKQIQKAKRQLEKHEGVKRIKFLKNKGKQKTEQILNAALIEKTKRLLGVKGYYTNLYKEADTTIIDQYHNLWHIEQVFRIAKSDLQTRPIYHFKKQTIQAHILICFMALAICKYMELKTKKSTKAMIKLLMEVTDARILHTLTNEEIILRSEISAETEDLIKKLSL